MKRLLSLITVIAIVISMTPSVLAAKDSIDMDELTGKLVKLDSIDRIDVSLPEGADYKTYKWTPAKDGVLSFECTVPEGVEITMLQGQNSVTYTNADAKFELEVVAGGEISIQLRKTGEPAVAFTMYGSFADPYGTEGNPVALKEMENQVKAKNDNFWYQCNFYDAIMTVTGTGDFSVVVNSNATAAQSGVVTLPVTGDDADGPFVFYIDKTGDYTVTFVYPVGHEQNPVALVIGENTANIQANSKGYFFTWTAQTRGELTLTMPNGNWKYTVNGEEHLSTTDPVCVIPVAKDDKLQLIVNTYDPENASSNPAGTLTLTAAFEEILYTPGNLNSDEIINEDDALYLLRHVLAPDRYQVDQPVDYNKDGKVNEDDALYLLRHVLAPERYPLV